MAMETTHCCAAVVLAVLALTAYSEATPQANWTWDIRNASAVYGAAYESPYVVFYGNVSAAEDCQRACAANASCMTFDYAYKSRHGDVCGYLRQCWLRFDNVYQPKQGHACIKESGHKVFPPPPPPPPPPPAPANAKNVLFIIFDDYRVLHKTWGFTQPHVPAADALAARSLAFDHAYCQQAVCGPSRASLLSGRRPDRTQMWNFVNGFRQTPGADKWRTMPEYFKTNGYYVGGCGKLFHPGDPVDFDAPRSWTDPIDQSGKTWPYFGQGHCPHATPNSHGCPVPKGVSATYPDVETLRVAKRMLANATTDPRPFWIGVGFVKPHMPHVFPAEFLDYVPKQADIVLAENPYNPKGASPMEWASGAEGPAQWLTPADNATAQDWIRNYYAAAAFSDSLLAELLAALNATGKADDTVIVLTADHGWGLGEHNHWIKYTNYETDARIPLMVHVPWAQQTFDKHTKTIVEHVDLYPTLAELAGIPVDKSLESIDGDSYAALFDASAMAAPGTMASMAANFSVAYTQYPRCCQEPHQCDDIVKNQRCAFVDKENFSYMGYSMRTEQWRYTEWAVWDGSKLKPQWNATVPSVFTELYDHGDDDGGRHTFDRFENENLAFAQPEVVRQLSAQLRAFFDKH